MARVQDEVLAEHGGATRASRTARWPAAGSANCSRRLCVSVKATSKRASARRTTVRSDVLELGRTRTRRNLRRAGTLIEQVAHLDGRAGRMRRGLRLAAGVLPRVDRHRARARRRGREVSAELRHRGDGRQRLAAETERGDPLQVVERGDLAGGVARERERQFLGRDAAAVVAHAQQADAAALDVDLDAARAGIQRVLDQFLDHGRRALDHLAGGDLVDERVVEAVGSAWACAAV